MEQSDYSLDGRLIFPPLTLSREERVLEYARSRFATVEQVEAQ